MIKKLKYCALTILAISVLITFKDYMIFHYEKYSVIHAPLDQTRRLGRHFIIGYHQVEEVKRLVQTGMIGGIYLTRRNIDGKSYHQIQKEIKTLQDIQNGLGLPPLFVAADQEGGAVSRLSPPLTPLGPISSNISHCYDFRELEERITGYASLQAVELSDLGVNLNLSPVVDLNTRGADKYKTLKTLIHKRAISHDPTIVTRAALAYCKGLENQFVFPTLKHFPGLGSVREETHEIEGKLDQALEQLETHDFLPFKTVARQTRAFIMLGHVKLMPVDPEYLASFSEKVIQGIIRKRWNHEGILITDDFNMGAVKNGKWGIGRSSVMALNAGADLILLSLDGKRYYEAMHALIRADNAGRLDQTILNQSDNRLALAKAQLRPPGKNSFFYRGTEWKEFFRTALRASRYPCPKGSALILTPANRDPRQRKGPGFIDCNMYPAIHKSLSTIELELIIKVEQSH